MYVLITLLLIVGVLCLIFTLSRLSDQHRFAFKNKQMMKKQQITLLIGILGIILVILAWFVF